MVSKESRTKVRLNKHRKIRNRFAGTAERPRLAVFRSNNHIYAQIIDDTVGNTFRSCFNYGKRNRKPALKKVRDLQPLPLLVQQLLKRALEKGIYKSSIWIRGGPSSQGKIQALADAAREAGLEF